MDASIRDFRQKRITDQETVKKTVLEMETVRKENDFLKGENNKYEKQVKTMNQILVNDKQQMDAMTKAMK